MRYLLVRYTTILVAMGVAGVAIGWLADDLRPEGQSVPGLGR